MTLKQIYRCIQTKPRDLTAAELVIVLVEADWKVAFDLWLMCPNPPRELERRVAELAPAVVK